MPLHVSSGFTVLALTLVRIAWRLSHKPPALLPAPGWQHAAAHIVHVALYGLMLALPLTGFAILSCHPARPVGAPGPGLPRVWGLFDLPVFAPLQTLAPAVQKLAHERFVLAHTIFGWLMLALLVMHVAAALWHQFGDRQPQFKRMGIG
jgi:cytochrome b561